MVTTSIDRLTPEQLRHISGRKWSDYPDCIGAWVAEMDFGTSPEVKQALGDMVDAGFFGYTPQADIDRLKTSVADWYADTTGWEIPVDRIRPLPDVIQGLVGTLRHFTPEGSHAIVPVPAYMPFLSVPQLCDRELVTVEMHIQNGRWELDLDAIDSTFAKAPKGSALILCNPCNPLGRVYERQELEDLAVVVEKHGGRVFSDEIHAPIVYAGGQHIPYASVSDIAANHTTTTVSGSKAWNLPGLKCAEMIFSNDADLEHWKKVGMLDEHGASSIGIVANAVAFSESRGWLNEVLTYLDGSRKLLGELLAEHLPEAGYIEPEGTYLTWIDLTAYDLPDDLGVFFRDEAKVAVTNGTACGESGKGSIRFNMAMSHDLLRQTIGQMATAVNTRA